MLKDYDAWNEKKKVVDIRLKPNFIHDGEVWMSYIGLNIGTEANGVGKEFMRPVLIIKRVRFEQVWCVPFSTQDNRDYVKLNYKYKGKENFANILQLKTIDSGRLAYKMGKLSDADITLIKQKICNTLGLQI